MDLGSAYGDTTARRTLTTPCSASSYLRNSSMPMTEKKFTSFEHQDFTERAWSQSPSPNRRFFRFWRVESKLSDVWHGWYIWPVVVLLIFYLLARTFYEYNSLSASVNDGQIKVPDSYDDSVKQAFTALFSQFDNLRAEQEKMRKEVSEMRKGVNIHDLSLVTEPPVMDGQRPFMDVLKELIAKEYESFRISQLGRPDYALLENGATVVDHTPTSAHGSKVLSFANLPLFWDPKRPETVISKTSENIVPGECWPFEGSVGFVTIRLSVPVLVDTVSYEHVSSRIVPPEELRSAPKLFKIYFGVEESKVDEHYIGNFTFHPREWGAERMELRHAVPANFVVVAVESNHGHPQFTCLYRIRVHGKRF